MALRGLLYITIGAVVWWSILVLITMVGIVKLKLGNSTIVRVLLYFTVQEVVGLTFILFATADLVVGSLLVKGGFAPFHFWLAGVMYSTTGRVFRWMLSIQKIPYLICVRLTITWRWVIVVVLGSIIPLVQSLVSNRLWHLVFLLLTSSANHTLLVGIFDAAGRLVVFLLYSITIYLIVGPMSSTHCIIVGYELVFVLIGLPGGLPFYIKITALWYISNGGTIMVIVVLLGFVLNLLAGFNLVNFLHRGPKPISKLLAGLVLVLMSALLV